MSEVITKNLRIGRKVLFLAGCFVSAFSLQVFASQEKLLFGVSSQVRQELLNTIRPRLEAEANVKVKFLIKQMTVQGNKAAVCVLPRNLDGSKLDMKKSILAEIYEDMKSGEMDGIETGLEGSYSILLKRDGQWYEVEWSGGPNVCAK